MPRLHRTLKHVRTAAALAPARPAWGAGLRAAVSTVAPLLASQLAGWGGGTWMSLAGFNGALTDRGGPYRTRAATLGVLTTSAAVVATLGGFAAGHLAASVALAFLVALACSLARGWGAVGAAVGGPVLCTFLISLAHPSPGPAEALGRAGWVMAGGAWAMLLALVLWPLRPYRPLRLAVARCYEAVAAYADEVAELAAGRSSSPDWMPRPAPVRAALEEARTALAAMRRGRPGESGRGERLLVLRESADQLFGQLVALSDVVETLPRGAGHEAARAALGDTLRRVAETAHALAATVETEHDAEEPPVAWDGAEVRARIAEEADAEARAQYGHAALLLDRLARFARMTAATSASLEYERPAEPAAPANGTPGPLPLSARIRSSLAADAVVRRHALRVSIVTAAAVWIAMAAGVERGYWMSVTAVIILQPYSGATTNKALQRIAGTVLGAMLTALLGAWFRDPSAILVLSFLFAGISVALLPLNYAVYSVFLTPTFVLLAEVSAGDWHLAGVRVLNTLLGSALALAGAKLLWPAPEWNRLPAYTAAALRANREYLRRAVSLFGDRSEDAAARIREARRGAGLAITNAEESFQRLLGEHRGGDEELEPAMTILTFSRRLAASITALATARHAERGAASPALEAFARAMEEALEDVAAAVEARRAPRPLPALLEPDTAEAVEGTVLGPRVDRLARQVFALHEAATRWSAAPTEPVAVAG